MKNFIAKVMTVTKKTAAAIQIGSPVVLDQSNTDYVLTTTTANNKAVLGVALDTSVAGGDCEILMLGVGPVNVATAAACAVGDLLTSHTVAGAAVEATAGQESFAKVLVAPGADNELVTCFVNCSTRG